MYIEFDLPRGYKDKEGNLHTRVVMRRATNKDLMVVAADAEVRELQRTGTSIPLNEFDGIKSFLARAAIVRLNSVLFSRVVERIGDIVNPGRAVFHDLDTKDFSVIEERYEAFMADATDEDKKDKGEESGTDVPFAPQPSAS